MSFSDFDGDGRAELLVTSPWGIGLLKLSGGALSPVVMAANGTRFGGWLLNTLDNRFGPVGDFDGDGRAELLVTSPWGIGLLKLSGGALSPVVMAANGTRVGASSVATARDRVEIAARLDGDGGAQLLVSSAWGLAVIDVSDGGLLPVTTAPNGASLGGWRLNTADNHFAVGMESGRSPFRLIPCGTAGAPVAPGGVVAAGALRRR